MIELHLHVRQPPLAPQADVPSPVAIPPVQAEVLIEGPTGDFCWHENDARPVVLLALGRDFASLKSMVEFGLEQHLRRPLHIYWGVGAPDDLYLHALVQGWAESNDHIDYTPVVRLPTTSGSVGAWRGRVGEVVDALVEDLPDLSPYRIYLSADSPAADSLCRRLIDDMHADPSRLLATWPGAF